MIKIRDDMNGVHEGATFGEWTVLGKCFRMQHWYAVAKCSCGEVSAVQTRHLATGASKRCQHCRYCGKYIQRIRHIWTGMIKRCYNANASRFRHYGGRGIVVCDEWRNSQDAFVSWAIQNGYQEHLEIERNDNDGPYSPQNCRWATRKEQTRNKRTTRLLTAFGETKPMAAWAEDVRCAVSGSAFADRIYRGWATEAALTTDYLRPGIASRAS